MNFQHIKSISFFLFLAFAGTFTLSSCEKDDDGDPEPNEQELITTVRLSFTAGGNTVVFTAKDADGIGGNPPEIDDILLNANTNYTLTIEFLDESDPSDIEDITEEVKEEDEEHLVCFTVSGDLAAPVIQDKDGNGDPLGLVSTLTTGNAGFGTLSVLLKHEADKGAADPCTTGETDAQVTFSVTIL